ncbi:MAG: aminotransferase class I/II-fold pyridoxal phosphate-dependent enzyme [Anaerolineaceae bacterium]|nr:aminotransferase class I/II-fold pyridoxal phosphate-dependent enzyme [Anaerolineaceae bacterium]
MEISPANRISQIKPYFFAGLEKTFTELRQSGMQIIRLDIGSPDMPPQKFIIDSLVEAVNRSDVHGYGPSGGSPALRAAFASYYLDRFDLELDVDKEVLGLIGSKEGIFNLSQVLINPGDLVLLPDPSYPVYAVGATIAQAETYDMPLLAENDFLPDLDAIPDEVADRAKLMWLNYPNNPTGAVAPYAFFERVVAFAKKHKIVIAHDAPYVDICFDNYKAPSILQVPGAKDVAVEFNSLSKAYNMAGWRVGMAMGNPEIIHLLRVYKSQQDSSLFLPVMMAAETAILGDQSWLETRNKVYQDRRDVVVSTLLDLGFTLEVPKASIYVWAKLPEAWEDSFAFCDKLLREAGVSVTPGEVYGPSGAGYIRISLVIPIEKLTEAMTRMRIWMEKEK